MLTIGPTSYRGPERRTLKTAEKQPKKVPSGPRAKCRGKSRKTAGWAAKQPKNSCFARFGCFSGCFSAVSPALYTRATRHLFRLFLGCFQGPAFGASVAGRADRNSVPFSPPKSGNFLHNFRARKSTREYKIKKNQWRQLMEEYLKISEFSRISRKWSDSPLFSTIWSDSPLFSTIWQFSRISRISRI